MKLLVVGWNGQQKCIVFVLQSDHQNRRLLVKLLDNGSFLLFFVSTHWVGGIRNWKKPVCFLSHLGRLYNEFSAGLFWHFFFCD